MDWIFLGCNRDKCGLFLRRNELTRYVKCVNLLTEEIVAFEK
jgi:hypothetical protein